MSTTSSGFHRSVTTVRVGSATSASSAARPMKSWSNFTARPHPSSIGLRRRARASAGSTLPDTLDGGVNPIASRNAV